MKKYPFGFVTSCYPKDKFMVQATLASIHHYCPDVPICLIVDGDVDVRDLERQYGLIILRVDELPDPLMREIIGSSTRSKLAALWEGPFDHYVWLDSDAIVWGDFTKAIDMDLDFEIFWSDEFSLPPECSEIPSWLPHFYFDPIKLNYFDPKFEWRGLSYFCDGVFACKKNAFTFDEFREIFAWRNHPDSPWADDFVCQPFVNYLIHSKFQKGEIRIGRSDLQYISGHVGDREIIEDLDGCGWRFPSTIDRPRAAHFCGRKPFIHNVRSDGKAFTIARLEHYRRTRGELRSWLEVFYEECNIIFRKSLTRLGNR